MRVKDENDPEPMICPSCGHVSWMLKKAPCEACGEEHTQLANICCNQFYDDKLRRFSVCDNYKPFDEKECDACKHDAKKRLYGLLRTYSKTDLQYIDSFIEGSFLEDVLSDLHKELSYEKRT